MLKKIVIGLILVLTSFSLYYYFENGSFGSNLPAVILLFLFVLLPIILVLVASMLWAEIWTKRIKNKFIYWFVFIISGIVCAILILFIEILVIFLFFDKGSIPYGQF